MSLWLRVLISSTLAACATRSPNERERALERIPAGAQVILAADGSALAAPAFRAVLDSLASHVPAALDCVLAAAQTSDSVAVGASLDAGATIVVVTRVPVASCPSLSRIDDDVYVATIGDSALASGRAASVLAGPTWERARPYLLREPLAVAADASGRRMIAVAQPEPLDAWVAVDAADAEALARRVQAQLDLWRTPTTAELAAKLRLARHGSQVRVDATALSTQDAVRIATTLLALAEEPHPPRRATFSCAPPGALVIRCRQDTHYEVTSVAGVLRQIGARATTPVFVGGEIVGLRLAEDAPPLLRTGDVLVGVGAHRLDDPTLLLRLADRLGRSTALAVRRDGVDAILELSQQ